MILTPVDSSPVRAELNQAIYNGIGYDLRIKLPRMWPDMRSDKVGQVKNELFEDLGLRYLKGFH